VNSHLVGIVASDVDAVRAWKQSRQEVFLPLSHPPGVIGRFKAGHPWARWIQPLINPFIFGRSALHPLAEGTSGKNEYC
jgi:hypothetical protein